MSDDDSVPRGFGRLLIAVEGRPAPQGSKEQGRVGQLRESSRYLPAWRAAVKRAIYARYAELGIDPESLPLFVGPVGVRVVFYLDTGQRIDGPPDGDKLTRATWDVLGCVPKVGARVIEDDGRIVEWSGAKFAVDEHVGPDRPGALIEVWSVRDAGAGDDAAQPRA